MAQISKRNGSYTIRCSCGSDVNGKRIVKNMTWKPDKGMTAKQIEKELERQAAEFEQQCAKGEVLDRNITFAKYVEDVWISRAEKEIKATTFSRYKEMLKRIIPAIGHYKLCQIQPYHLYSFYDDLRESKREDARYIPNEEAIRLSRTETYSDLAEHTEISTTTVGCIRSGKKIRKKTAEKFSDYFNKSVSELFEAEEQPLSDRTILNYHRVISVILQSAVYDEILTNNPCQRTRAPRVEHKEAKYLDDVQAEQLICAITEKAYHPFDTIVIMLLLTGMRRGECCGLEWNDIDFESCTININKALLYLYNKGIFENDTKTYSSKRVIKVGRDLMDILAEYREWQNAEKEKLGDKWNESGKVFTAMNGKPINPYTVSAWFHRFMVESGLPYVSLHGLRHTNASIMISNGVPITTTAKRLGHSTSATTSRIYAHAIASADAVAADTIQSILPVK